MIFDCLKQLGLSDKAVKVLMTHFQLGPQPASVLARKAGLNRSTTYVLLGELMAKGLVSSFTSNGMQIFAPISPRNLLALVKCHTSELDHQAQVLELNLPQLIAITEGTHGPKPRIQYFDGFSGVKTVMEDMLTSTETLCSFSPADIWLSGADTSSYIRSYGQRRTFVDRVPLRVLVPDCKIVRDYLDYEYPHDLCEYRYLVPQFNLGWNAISIYDDKVALVSLNPQQMFGVLIESPEVAAMQKALFEVTWASSVVPVKK